MRMSDVEEGLYRGANWGILVGLKRRCRERDTKNAFSVKSVVPVSD